MLPEEIFDFFAPNVLNETINISLKHGYLYFEVPKAGSVSIKTALHALEIGDLPGPSVGAHPPTLHSPFIKPYQLSRTHLLSLLRDPAVFKFSFVRDPFARFLSAYLNMMFGQDGGFVAYYREQLGFGEAEDVAFGAFADRVCNQTPRGMDKHWRPQFYQSFAAFCDLDLVGKLETFDADVRAVSGRIGIDLSCAKVAPHATDATQKLREYYTPEIAAMVADTYAIDFMQFGYDADPSSITSLEPQPPLPHPQASRLPVAVS